MTLTERFDRAEKRIKKGWCQGYYARNAAGLSVSPDSAEACQWCLLGSLGGSATPSLAELHVGMEAGDPYVIGANDAPGTTKRDVLRWLRKARKALGV